MLTPLGPSGRPEEVLAARAAALAAQAAAVEPPPPVLDGWSSLCAVEYAAAVLALRGRLAHAVEALQAAGRPT